MKSVSERISNTKKKMRNRTLHSNKNIHCNHDRKISINVIFNSTYRSAKTPFTSTYVTFKPYFNLIDYQLQIISIPFISWFKCNPIAQQIIKISVSSFTIEFIKSLFNWTSYIQCSNWIFHTKSNQLII